MAGASSCGMGMRRRSGRTSFLRRDGVRRKGIGELAFFSVIGPNGQYRRLPRHSRKRELREEFVGELHVRDRAL